MAGFDGPVVPRRMTGALKLMLGILAGGWKLEGSPPGRPGCWLFDCMPGGGPTPGAATSHQQTNRECNDMAHRSQGEAAFQEVHCSQGSLQKREVAHMEAHLACVVSSCDDSYLQWDWSVHGWKRFGSYLDNYTSEWF